MLYLGSASIVDECYYQILGNYSWWYFSKLRFVDVDFARF